MDHLVSSAAFLSLQGRLSLREVQSLVQGHPAHKGMVGTPVLAQGFQPQFVGSPCEPCGEPAVHSRLGVTVRVFQYEGTGAVPAGLCPVLLVSVCKHVCFLVCLHGVLGHVVAQSSFPLPFRVLFLRKVFLSSFALCVWVGRFVSVRIVHYSRHKHIYL